MRARNVLFRKRIIAQGRENAPKPHGSKVSGLLVVALFFIKAIEVSAVVDYRNPKRTTKV